jgi:hypothetical protein
VLIKAERNLLETSFSVAAYLLHDIKDYIGASLAGLINPKSETRNPKQMGITEIQMTEGVQERVLNIW